VTLDVAACYTWPMQVEVLGLSVNYEEVGEGRPVVFLHGGRADHRLMTVAFEPVFEGRDSWRRIYPDLPGMGRTPGADWITCEDDMLAVVEGFVDAVVPTARVALVGASYGGYLAVGYVHRRPEKLDGLGLIAPSLRAIDNPAGLPPHQVFARDDALVASLAEDELPWLGISVVQVAETLEFFRAGALPGRRIADVAFLERVDAGPGLSVDVAAPLPTPFPAPTLMLMGRQDNVVGWSDAIALLDSFPRATCAVLDRAGHAVRAEQNVLFRALVGEWLDRIELEPAS
jgi:pimeloyl-ACP methyl ester carboxylesterase